MELRTLARDCLYLNWALPLNAAPELPEPLRYEVHSWNSEDYVFSSVLLFQLSGLHFRSLPLLRVSYPQMNLRLYVLDGEGVPSVLFLRHLVPLWVVPGTRLLARQPTEGAHFTFPSPSDGNGDTWCWNVGRGNGFEVKGRMSAPSPVHGPKIGSWESTVDYFRHRRRGYARWKEGLRSVKTSHPPVEVWPFQVEITDFGLVAESLPRVAPEVWQHPHSAWLCPEIPFNFVLHKTLFPALTGQRVPAAGCYRVAAPPGETPYHAPHSLHPPCATISAPCPPTLPPPSSDASLSCLVTASAAM